MKLTESRWAIAMRVEVFPTEPVMPIILVALLKLDAHAQRAENEKFFKRYKIPAPFFMFQKKIAHSNERNHARSNNIKRRSRMVSSSEICIFVPQKIGIVFKNLPETANPHSREERKSPSWARSSPPSREKFMVNTKWNAIILTTNDPNACVHHPPPPTRDRDRDWKHAKGIKKCQWYKKIKRPRKVCLTIFS